MSRTRIGKIARLPLDVRNDLNQRLQDGKSGKAILAWLNRQKIGEDIWYQGGVGVNISEQNLSNWRAGGYQDWLQQQEALDFVRLMAEEAGELGAAADGEGIADRFTAILAVELTRLAKVLLEKESDPEKRWARLGAVSDKLSQIRRDDHRAAQVKMKREQWKREQEREEEAMEEQYQKKSKAGQSAALNGLMQIGPLSELLGGGAAARHLVAKRFELEHDLPEGCLSDLPQNRVADEGRGSRAEGKRRKSGGGNPSESSPVQPNQGLEPQTQT